MKRVVCFCLTLCLLLSLPLAFSSCEKDSPDVPSNARILAKSKEMWTDYYRLCNAVNIPHSYIRTAIEDLVRAHITVEEGMVYRPELYE